MRGTIFHSAYIMLCTLATLFIVSTGFQTTNNAMPKNDNFILF